MRVISVLLAIQKDATRAACVDALRRAADVRVVGHAASALEALRHVLTLRPRVVVVEASLARRALTPFLQLISRRSPGSRVLVIGTRSSHARIVDLLVHGAHGHLEHRDVVARLPVAVRVTAAGENWVPRRLVSNVLSRLGSYSRRRWPRSSAPARRRIGPWSNGHRRLAQYR